MTRLSCWLVTRRLETILWFSVLLGLLTIVPVIGIITFELFIPTLRVSWWVIIFAISWMSTGAWSAIASLCMHAEYTLKDVLMVQVLPQVPPEGDRNINHERIRRAFSDTSNQQRLTKRWRNYLNSHIAFLCCAIVTTSVRLGLFQVEHPATAWSLVVLTVLAFGFAWIPLIVRAQFRIAGVTLQALDRNS